MKQTEACDILFPAVCGDLTLLLENITRFDDVFFETLEKLRHEAAQISDPMAAQNVEAVRKLIYDPRLLSLAVIHKLFISHDIESRNRLCEKNATFMDDMFFEVWRSEIIDMFDRDRKMAEAKHSRSRYNEAVALVRELLPERRHIPFVSTFSSAQTLYTFQGPTSAILVPNPPRSEQEKYSAMPAMASTDDYVTFLRKYTELERAYPAVNTDPAKFRRIILEVFSDFGWPQPSDDEITALMRSLPPTFNSDVGEHPDLLEFYLEMYKRLMSEQDRMRLAQIRIATLPVASQNARCIAAPGGEPVIVCYFGLIDMIEFLTHAVSSVAVDWGKKEIFGDRARRLSPHIVKIMHGQRCELPFIGDILKTGLGAALYQILSTYEIYQKLFLIGHELEHIRLGHLRSAPKMSHSLGDAHPLIDIILFARKAEFAADTATIEKLVSAKVGMDTFIAVDILFQYLDLWEDVVGCSLPTVSDHPTAEERRWALRQTWPAGFDREKLFPVHMVAAFLRSVRQDFAVQSENEAR